MKFRAVLLLAVLTAPALAATQAISIIEDALSFSLTVPASGVILQIPKSGMSIAPTKKTRSTASPRYFHFEDLRTGLIATGWFEPAGIYKGFKANWDINVSSWKKNGIPSPESVSFEQEGDWEFAIYSQVGGKKQLGRHFLSLHAECIKAGTWIELHLSTPLLPDAKERLLGLIRTTWVIPKS